jgi:hypothetical protein
LEEALDLSYDRLLMMMMSVTTISILFIVVVQILGRIEYRFIFLFLVDFVWNVLSDNKEFLYITHTVEHNYISPNSTVGIQLHVSAIYVGHLQVVI